MNDSTTFSEDPAAMARRWLDAGARRLHLVDLNGAFAGKPVNESAVKAILAEVGDEIPVQLGGGIRDLDTIERYLDDGLQLHHHRHRRGQEPGLPAATPAAPSAATSSSASTPRTARSPPTAGASSPATR